MTDSKNPPKPAPQKPISSYPPQRDYISQSGEAELRRVNNPVQPIRIGWNTTVRSLLALVTACAAWAAYYRATLEHKHTVSELERAAFAAGLLPRDTPNTIQARGEIGFSKSAFTEIWIPYGRTVQLNYGTRPLYDDLPPQDLVSQRLGPGLHTIEVTDNSQEESAWQILLDGKSIFERAEVRNDWNLRKPWRADRSGLPSRTIESNILLFESYGTPHLAADERYDPNKHRFGLRIWLSQ